MFYSDDPQDALSQARKQPQQARRSKSLFSSFARSGNSEAGHLPVRLLWAVILVSPLLICAIIFLSIMFSTYNTQLAIREPADELTFYIGEIVAVGAIILASVAVGLLGVFKMKLRKVFYGTGIVLFIALMVIFESFISSSNTVYAIQPHLEITRAGFSPAQMSIFTDDKLLISNAPDNVAQILSVSSSTNSGGIPAQLLHPGLTLQPGQSVDVTFSSGGTFTLSSSTIPGLTLTITVIETSNNGFDNFFQ